MKILHINFTDVGGGAAQAAVRIVNALNERDISSELGVSKKTISNPFVFELPQKKNFIKNKIIFKICSFIKKLFTFFVLHFPFHPFRFTTTNGIFHSSNLKSSTDINWINNSDFDLINLHWISDVISIKDIAKIKKPIVWTMHDSWPCCGAEHHPNIWEGDKRWQEGYFRSNKPKSTHGVDLCRKVWNQKKKYLTGKNITFVAPSNWEHDVLKSSALFKNNTCYVVPNIIDHSVFYPRDKNTVRKVFGIPQDKIVIGFGAAYDIDDPKSMKGSYILVEALKKLPHPEKYFLVIFGPVGDSFTKQIAIPFFASGYISNPNILACIYSACDCIVNPSLIENLPTTCLEAISCAVPVVAFDVGGTKDIVVHKKTGYLATPYNTDELVDGIAYCITHHDELAQNALDKSIKDFDTEATVQKMIHVYQSVLNN